LKTFLLYTDKQANRRTMVQTLPPWCR